MHARPGAGADDVADPDVAIVPVTDRDILADQVVDLLFEQVEVDIRLLRKAQDKAVPYVGVQVLFRHAAQTQKVGADIFRRMGHAPEGDRLEDDVGDILRLRSEQSRPGDDQLFADPDDQVRVAVQKRIDQLEMLDDHPFAQGDGRKDGLRQHMHLGEGRFEADIHVVAVRAEKAGRFLRRGQQRQRPDVDAVVVVGQFQTREHALDQHALARPGFADQPDQLVERTQVLLGDLHAEIRHARQTPGRKIDGVKVAFLHAVRIGHGNRSFQCDISFEYSRIPAYRSKARSSRGACCWAP